MDYLSSETPLEWLEQEVTADDGAWDDRFGTSVAVAGDTAVIGAFDAKIDGNYYEGAAYVFKRIDGVWTQTQKLLASDGAASSKFGAAVALDGSTMLISAIGANVADHSAQGAVYVFAESAGVWTQVQKLVSSDGAGNDAFGNALALDGSTALVGAVGASVSGNTLQGKAYVFAESDGIWTQQQVLAADDGSANDRFGESVALDGDVALVGAPTLTYNFNHAGFAYVFTHAGPAWAQTQKLVPAETALGDQFGYAVGLSGDTALITSTGNQYAHGAAYVFKNTDDTWSETQKLSPGDSASGDEFGNALVMSGSMAIIGAQRMVVADHQGSAHVFVDADGSWSETHEFTTSAGTALDFFGGSLAFDGTTALVGMPGASIGENNFQGSAFFYTPSGGDASITTTPGSLAATQAGDVTTSQVLTIGNEGTGDLIWTIAEADTDCAAPGDIGWASANPLEGTTSAAAGTAIDVTFDSSGLAAGSYTGLLCIASNDPAHTTVSVPISLAVTPTEVTDRIFCSGFEAGATAACPLSPAAGQ